MEKTTPLLQSCVRPIDIVCSLQESQSAGLAVVTGYHLIFRRRLYMCSLLAHAGMKHDHESPAIATALRFLIVR